MSVKFSSSLIRKASDRLNPLHLIPLMQSEKRRPVTATTCLVFFIAAQWYMPQLLFISEVNAQGRILNPPVKVDTIPLSPTTNINTNSKRGALKKSESTDCEDCKVTVRALNLKKVPTERELRQAGQFGGALSPIGNADVDKLKTEMDNQLKAKGISPAVAAVAPEITVAGRLGKIKREKVKTLEDINLSFGKAMQEWNKHNYRVAAQMLQKHVEDYPDSPWAGEALLHLGCDSKYNGRFAEAQARYDQLLQATSDDPNDPSNEIHQKTKLRWADLDIATGKLSEAQAKLRNIIATDKDWRRQTWAITWLRRTTQYKKNARDLRACGSQALGYMLASLDYNEASRVVSQMAPPRDSGFNLAELKQISARYGVPLEGFRAQPEQLASLPTPLLLHYDFDKATPKLDTLSLSIGKAVTKIRQADSKTKATPAEKNLYAPRNRAGHYVVANRIDAKKRIVSLYDPQGGRYFTLTFDQLKREWSGAGLMRAGKKSVAVNANAAQPRIAALSSGEMDSTVGGCCGAPRPGGGPGAQPFDNTAAQCAPCAPKGAPLLTINTVSFNARVEDTPIWYDTPIGPDVEFTMNYNSSDAINQNTAMGNKWVFNYGSYVIEDTGAGGGVVTVFMPDGAQENFYPDSSGQYHPQKGKFERLVKRSATRYEVIAPTGDRMIYDIPAGTDSLQSMLVEVRDRWGYSLHMGYTAGFTVLLTSVTDAQGKVTGLVYDEDGHIIKVRDPFGREAKFDYEGGNLVRAVDMEGNSFNYAYNSRIELTQINSAQGVTKIDTDYPYHGQTYSQTNITITNPKGEKARYIWDGIFDGPEFTRYIDKRGAETRYYIGEVIDGEPKVTKVVDALGNTTNTTYEYVHGFPASVTDARGATSSMQYNAMGQVVRTVDPKGRVSQLFYDPSNGIDLISAKDSRGRTVGTITYNEKHQPLSVTDRQNRTSTYTYTAWGAPLSETDSESHVSTVTYDATSKRPLSSAFDGITQGSVTYDAIGRVKTSTDMTGVTLSYEYNELNKLTRTTYPDGTYTATVYACCSLPGVTRDLAGRKTYYDYDELFRPIRVQQPDGQTLEFDYDAEGNLTRFTDSNGSKTSFAYDAIGRVTSKTYADGKSEAISYDVPNGIISTRDAKGQITRSFYDVVGNLTLTDYPTIADVSIKYNDLDQETEIRDGVGTTLIGYDDEDRITTINGPWDNDLLTYSYDSAGRSTGMKIGTGGAISHQVVYSYDALERLSTLTSGAGTFTYNYVGNTDLLEHLDLPNGTIAEQSYDSLLRLTEVNNRKGTTTLAKYNYAYDNRDVRTGVQAKLGSDPLKEIAYTYDAVDQLIGEVATGGATGSSYSNAFTYDAMGNRTGAQHIKSGQTTISTGVPNALNQLTSVSHTVNGTPAEGASLKHDANGNLSESISTDGSKTLFTYDDADRLVCIEKRDTANIPLSKSEFFYDYASRKAISREFDWSNGAWDQQSEKRRIFDGLDVVQERSALNEVTANYTRDGNIAGILSRSSTSGNSYFHYDGNGNVTALSDENGDVVGRYSYDAFGKTETSGTRAGENPYRFSTKECHAASGMYDYGLRFYSPGMGRWINRDPIREAGGTNMYKMVRNNPINLIDEYGLLGRSPDCLVTEQDRKSARRAFGIKSDRERRDDWLFAQMDLLGIMFGVPEVGTVSKGLQQGAKTIIGRGRIWGSVKGYLTEPVKHYGIEFEEYLAKKLGGRVGFKMGGRQFDGAYKKAGESFERWFEAKSGPYWSNMFKRGGPEGAGWQKFTSDMGSRLRIAKENNARYELHSNSPIPETVKEWLTKKGIPFFEHLGQ